MRKILSSYLELALMLLLMQSANAQNVSIELTPITYPIVLPDSGGSFDYLLTVTNQGGTPITATVWCMATLPNGGSWGPVAGPGTQTLAPGQTIGYYRAQTVPPRAPFGYFMFYAYIGIYPDTVWAQDQFEFQHQALSGTEQEWVARYNGPGDSTDFALSLALDSAGNCYVTGTSYNDLTLEDYTTIKYDANGNELWMAQYNGPGNSVDRASAVALDPDENVYVTGWSTGNGTSGDCATIKYDANGNQLWAARYDGPANASDNAVSLALDAGGNAYVTGWSMGSETSWDYVTIKYDASGNQLWVARYDGPANSTDVASSLAIDGVGNVYVTGQSIGSGSDFDCTTIKYDANGNQLWVARYNGPGNGEDDAFSVVADAAANVYIAGLSMGSGSFHDYITIKYSTNGDQLWAERYDGPGNSADYARSLALDVAANVYVTGYSQGSGTSADYATIKYDTNGNRLWVSRYNGPSNGLDAGNDLALDPAANVYVTGFSTGSALYNYDYATIKYDASGNELWVTRYNGPGNMQDMANRVALDANANAYITGRSDGIGTYHDFATIKYSGGNLDNWMPVEATVLGQPLPQECRLEQNFPNPFNATTVLRYQLPVASHVKLEVFDISGRIVGARHASPLPLVDGWRQAGTHELTWDASKMPSGIYFARMQAGGYAGVQKLILLK